MLHACPALAALVLGLAQDQDASASATRVHDLGRLLTLEGIAEAGFDLAPIPGGREDVRPRDPVTQPAIDGDQLVEWLRATCVGKEEDAELELTPRFQLRVTAAADAQERIARMLREIEAAVLGDERLEVRVVAGAGVLDAPMVEETAAAERRIAQWVAAGRARVVQSGSTSLRDTFFSSIHDVATQRYVHDYEVEIAHGAVIYDPVTLEFETGLEAVVRAARAPEGTWLELAIRHSGIAATRDLTVRPKVWYASDWPHELEDVDRETVDVSRFAPAVFHGEVPLKIEFPSRNIVGFAGSLLLPAGQSLWILCRTQARSVAAEPLPVALEIHVAGSPRPARSVLADFTADGSAATVMHVGAWETEGFGTTPTDDATFRFEWFNPEELGGFWPSVVTAAEPLRSRVDRLDDAVARVAKADETPFPWCRLSWDLLLAKGARSKCDQLSEELAREFAPSSMVELRGRVTRVAETVAEFRVPAVTGRRATLWSGVTGSCLADWDVDVANEALVGNPDVLPYFDGVALQCVVHALHDGRAQVEVDGVVNLLDGPPHLESLLAPYTPVCERLRAQRWAVRESRMVEVVDGGAVMHLGGEPLGMELSLQFLGKPAPATALDDLETLVAMQGAAATTLDLCPSNAVGAYFEPETEPATNSPVDLGEVWELLEAVIERKELGAAATVEPTADHKTLRVSEAARETVDRTLGLLAKARFGEEQLEVALLVGDPLPDFPRVLDDAECDRRVAELVKAGKLRVVASGASALTDGVTTSIEQLASVTHVNDWEVEIAHGSVIYDPILSEHVPGLLVHARGSPADGATLLDLAVRFIDPSDGFRELVPRPTVWFSSPVPPASDPHLPDAEKPRGPSIFNAEIPLRIEYDQSRVTSFATSLRLPNGKAAWIPARVASQSGTSACAVVVKVLGPWRPRTQVLAAASAGDPEPAVLHPGVWPSVGFQAGPMDAITIASAFDYDPDPWWPSTVWAHGFDVVVVVDIARKALEGFEGGEDVLVAPFSTSHLFVQGPAEARARILERLDQALPPGRPIEISGRVTRRGETVSTFRLPATTGRLATIWAGVKGSFLPDWDVDVAGEAMIGNPERGTFLDGFALRFVARTAGAADAASAAEIQLEATGVVNLLDAPPQLEAIANPYTPVQEQLRSRRLFVDEIRNLRCVDGVAVARFGGEELGLEVTLRSK